MAGERTEKPTSKRRGEARQNGQVARSMEVNSALVLVATFGVLIAAGPALWSALEDSMRSGVIGIAHPEDASLEGIGSLAQRWGRIAFLMIAPFIAAASIAGILANVGQNKPGLFLNLLKPDLKKLEPLGGLKRMLGMHAAMELAKSIAKVGVVGAVAFLVLWPQVDRLATLGSASPREILTVTGALVVRLSIWVIGMVVVLAAADLIFQRRRHEKSLKMSKQEIKDESRQSDIAPEIKGAIRRKAMQMSRQRMLADVPTADVVITNPTHYAVALRYGADLAAPVVVAKGPDLLALRIREIAKQHDISIVENPPLARALYREVEVGREIPADFFGAVAEVLAYVYRTSRRQLAWA